MTAPFDIFEREKTGTLLWLGSAATIEGAEARIRQSAADASGEYVVLNQKTGNKVVVNIEAADGI